MTTHRQRRSPRRRNAPSDAPDQRRARRKRLHVARQAAGVCAKCGLDPSPPGTRCAECRGVRLAKTAAVKVTP